MANSALGARNVGDGGGGTQTVRRFPLLRYYLVASLVIIAVITVVVAYLFVREAEDNFADRSSTRGSVEASHIVQLFYFDIWAPNQQENPNLTLEEVIAPGILEAFGRRSTLGLSIVKLNLLDLDGNVLWSSVTGPIGKPTMDTDSHAAVVDRGTFTSNLLRDEVITDSRGVERRLDVVRTFYPIRDAPLDAAVESQIIGILEIEQDVTGDLADARGDSLRSAIAGSIGMGVILFVLLLLIIFRADRMIGRGHRRLLRQQEELQAAQAETMQLNESLDRRVTERTAELVQSQIELAEARDVALEATKAKSDFLANMSHELRTPLNAIIGYSEMLHEEAEDLGQEDFILDLQRIRGAGTHLLALINDILDLSRVEAGRMELYLETFSVSNVVKDTIAIIEPLVGKNANTLEVNCEDNIGSMRADMTKVRPTLICS